MPCGSGESPPRGGARAPDWGGRGEARPRPAGASAGRGGGTGGSPPRAAQAPPAPRYPEDPEDSDDVSRKKPLVHPAHPARQPLPRPGASLPRPRCGALVARAAAPRVPRSRASDVSAPRSRQRHLWQRPFGGAFRPPLPSGRARGDAGGRGPDAFASRAGRVGSRRRPLGAWGGVTRLRLRRGRPRRPRRRPRRTPPSRDASHPRTRCGTRRNPESKGKTRARIPDETASGGDDKHRQARAGVAKRSEALADLKRRHCRE